MRFVTRELLSKWGLEDGDILQPLLARHGFDLSVLNDHDVLRAIVREFVVPVIVNSVEVHEVCTMHNPIRISKVDGVAIDNEKPNHSKVELQPDVVEVSDEIVLEYANRAMRASTK